MPLVLVRELVGRVFLVLVELPVRFKFFIFDSFPFLEVFVELLLENRHVFLFALISELSLCPDFIKPA